MNSKVKYPDVSVQLTGGDGNAFVIIGKIGLAIYQKHGRAAAQEWYGQATSQGSYDAVLLLAMSTVDTY